jgi:hypothetical protein
MNTLLLLLTTHAGAGLPSWRLLLKWALGISLLRLLLLWHSRLRPCFLNLRRLHGSCCCSRCTRALQSLKRAW